MYCIEMNLCTSALLQIQWAFVNIVTIWITSENPSNHKQICILTKKFGPPWNLIGLSPITIPRKQQTIHKYLTKEFLLCLASHYHLIFPNVFPGTYSIFLCLFKQEIALSFISKSYITTVAMTIRSPTPILSPLFLSLPPDSIDSSGHNYLNSLLMTLTSYMYLLKHYNN